MSKLVVRLLATAALRVRIQTKIQHGRHKHRSVNTLYPTKNTKIHILIYCFEIPGFGFWAQIRFENCGWFMHCVLQLFYKLTLYSKVFIQNLKLSIYYEHLEDDMKDPWVYFVNKVWRWGRRKGGLLRRTRGGSRPPCFPGFPGLAAGNLSAYIWASNHAGVWVCFFQRGA